MKFEVGKTYSTRSLCDYDTIYSFTILGRTPKTVTVEVNGKLVKRGLREWDGVEVFSPFGRYSMSATITAKGIDRENAISDIKADYPPDVGAALEAAYPLGYRSEESAS